MYLVLSLLENHAKKELQSFSHCNSFGHPNMHLLDNYEFFFSVCNYNLEKQIERVI